MMKPFGRIFRNKELTSDEENLVKQYRELDEIKWALHDLLKKIMIKSGCGDSVDDYTDTIWLDIGDLTVTSCGYYHELTKGSANAYLKRDAQEIFGREFALADAEKNI